MLDKIPYLLVADDTPDVLDLIVTGVQMRGWKCETATTPSEIIEQVKTHCEEPKPEEAHPVCCFDVLICDIYYKDDPQNPQEPRRTGVSAIRQIRKQYFQNLPVIFITAWDVAMLRREALTVGQELIAKPFDVDYLLDRVKIWIDWAKPRTFKGQERRRYGINRSGKYRRGSDTQLRVPNEYPQQELAATPKR